MVMETLGGVHQTMEVCSGQIVQIRRKKHCWLFNMLKILQMNVVVGPILDNEGMGAFFGVHFSEKRAFCLLAPPKQVSFLTISNKNIFFKTEGTRLGVIVAPN